MMYYFKLSTFVILNVNSLSFWCDRYDVNHKDIVIRQAMLESLYMRCTNCALSENNNIFGFQTSEGYIKFNHWTESVKFYSEYQKKYYSGGDYYEFLKKYWGAPNMDRYILKLKSIEKNEQKRRI